MIGLGMAAIGRPHYINIKNNSISDRNFDLAVFKTQGKHFLTEAYQAGIRHFDTAPSYGVAEEILSEWIAEFQPKDIIISSKWGYTYVANFDKNAIVHEVKNHTLETLERQSKTTFERLKNIQIYQIHSATLESGVLENQEVLEKLYQIKKERNIEIGLSTSGVNQNEIIKKALQIKCNNEALFDVFQVTYNLLEQNLLNLKEELKFKKVIIKEAMANGRIFLDKNDGLQIFQNLATKYNVGIDAIALQFVIATLNPYSVLSGVTHLDQLNENLKANSFSLEDHEIELLKTVKQTPEDYWEDRKKLSWQ
ncbi:aldo/keto reductase [Flavobacterium sp. Fl-318]|uniref:Aldo/keto reductase n=1 Tax=Flavobacterium cupriresistens TaxID=2893885 RepID=A0ABU4RC24_9FLAO|nr:MULTISPECIES: aldo/keto reductase [unclassified Flavobacterium]MDX6188086.1 aldo/keto reductase [Flavobacterium sp. Fl-318]UFH41994.1 aldo/keto reductase [Flavobacterium sp. F-323]